MTDGEKTVHDIHHSLKNSTDVSTHFSNYGLTLFALAYLSVCKDQRGISAPPPPPQVIWVWFGAKLHYTYHFFCTKHKIIENEK